MVQLFGRPVVGEPLSETAIVGVGLAADHMLLTIGGTLLSMCDCPSRSPYPHVHPFFFLDFSPLLQWNVTLIKFCSALSLPIAV